MKTSNIIIGLVVIVGIFILIPKSDQNTDTSKSIKTSNPAVTAELKERKAPMEYEKISATKATIETDKGTIELDLYPQDAPKTVTNFATLAKNGYYDGLTFHRVVNQSIFIIQGGDPTGTGSGGESVYGAKFEDALNPSPASYKDGDRRHGRGQKNCHGRQHQNY